MVLGTRGYAPREFGQTGLYDQRSDVWTLALIGKKLNELYKKFIKLQWVANISGINVITRLMPIIISKRIYQTRWMNNLYNYLNAVYLKTKVKGLMHKRSLNN
jgi:hypothetical protein